MKIFITGASRGIGHNIMTTALRHGHDVAFTYHNENTNVAGIVQAARDIAPKSVCRGYRLDVSNPDQVAEVVDQVIDDFDAVDVVVNNAGKNSNGLAFSMSDESWRDVIDTNLSGAFYVIRQFLPVFLARKRGRFISIGSIASKGMSGQANYSASKAGLIGLSGAIAKEYGQKGITSNVISPGFFDTDMTKDSMDERLKAFWMQHCPAKRMGKLEELSELVMFLASDGSAFINGQTINVTGGLDWAG